MCQQTAEYLVPCSTQSQFPYLWSAALRCTHGMAILGDPREESGVLGFPSRRGLTPRGSLECNPEIPAFPGEEYEVPDTAIYGVAQSQT